MMIYGRRNVFIIFIFLSILASITSMTNSFQILISARIINGICAGVIFTIVPIIIEENVPVDLFEYFGSTT